MTIIASRDYDFLKAALGEEFSVRSRLAELVKLATNRSLDRIALGDDLDEVIEKVINRADSEQWLPQLIEAYIELRPKSQHLNELRLRFQTVPVVVRQDISDSPSGSANGGAVASEQVDHYEVQLMRGGRALVNRRKLRDALRALEPDNGSRILIVDGGPVSGKTYSSQLISHLSRPRGFRFVWVDLERLAKAEIGPVGPAVVGRNIAEQMGLDGMPEPAGEQESRWVQSFCNWLGRHMANDQTNRWIVVDSFSKVLVSQGAHDLIQELARRAYLNIDNLRLVLLNYNDLEGLESITGGGIQYERIDPIGTRELAEFFTSVYLERERKHTRTPAAADLTQEIIMSVARVQTAAPASDPRRLFALGRAVSEEARSILGV